MSTGQPEHRCVNTMNVVPFQLTTLNVFQKQCYSSKIILFGKFSFESVFGAFAYQSQQIIIL